MIELKKKKNRRIALIYKVCKVVQRDNTYNEVNGKTMRT